MEILKQKGLAIPASPFPKTRFDLISRPAEFRQ
jgi:hypothetical protein